MSYKFLATLLLIPTISFGTITFLGILEDSSIDKNSFLCPSKFDAEGIDTCQDRGVQAVHFEFNRPRMLQLFNNQQFWIQRKYEKRQLLMARGYQEGNDLDTELKNKGWMITGGFSIVIITDPLITNQIESNIIAKNGQTKVVAQLWYNGSSLIQLWAQDVKVLSDGQSFSISLSSADSTISQEAKPDKKLSSPKNIQEIKKQFLQEVELSPRNIILSDYSVASGSPRNLKIVSA